MLSSFLSLFFLKVIFFIKLKENNCKENPKWKSRPNFPKITCKRFENKTKELAILIISGQGLLF